MEYNEIDDFSTLGRYSRDNIIINIKNKNMSRITGASILNALTIGIVSGVVALIAHFLGAGTVFGFDFKSLVDVFALAVFGAVMPFLQSLLVSPATGKFAGTVVVK